MVSMKEIHASNSTITGDIVAVFAGGTSGIGQLTLKTLAATASHPNTRIRIFIVGRPSAEARTLSMIQTLQSSIPISSSSSSLDIYFIPAEISLLSETRRVCREIALQTDHIDILFLTAGYAPFGGRHETTEGIEVAQSLEYYSRILFTQHLLPLLKAYSSRTRGTSPRVITVGGGGLESARCIPDPDDLDLRKPGAFGGVTAQTQYVAMNSLGFERLSEENPEISFIHSWPGWVSTGNVRRGHEEGSAWSWFVWLFLEPLVKLLSMRDEDCGQRYLFLATSWVFGGQGAGGKEVAVSGKEEGGFVNTRGEKGKNGMFLTNYKCDSTPNEKGMTGLRKKAGEKVWDHTQEVLKPYL